MKKLLILTLLFLASCSLNKVIQHHGVHSLEKKQTKLKINITNKNEIVKFIGPPSTKSTFDNDIFIYIERKTSNSKLLKLGKKKLIVSNVLLLEIDDRGMLITKKFYNQKDLKNLKFSKKNTEIDIGKQSFINKALSGIKTKINDPLGKKRGSLGK